MAFMPIPYSRSPLLARETFVHSAPMCAMTQTLDLPRARLHGTSRANRAKRQPSLAII